MSESDPLLGVNAANRAQIYRELRERTPVYWSNTHAGWVLTRYADVSAMLRHEDVVAMDARAFFEAICRRGSLELESLVTFVSSLSFMSPSPRHDAIRRLLIPLVGGTRRGDLQRLLEKRAGELLDEGKRSGAIDLAEGYGRILALAAAAMLLGIPEEDAASLARIGSELTIVFERSLPSIATLKMLNARAASLLDYFAQLVPARRKSPRDDGITLLVKLADESSPCNDSELAGYCAFFFIASQENTAIAIAAAAQMLLKRPSLRSRLERDRSALSDAAREFLRLATPVQFVVRETRTALEVGSQSIRAKEPLILMLGAANRDPAVYTDPDEPHLDRSGPEPLAFSAGPHRCLGASLATAELEIAIGKILEYPSLTLSDQPAVWAPRMNIAQLEKLAAQFD